MRRFVRTMLWLALFAALAMVAVALVADHTVNGRPFLQYLRGASAAPSTTVAEGQPASIRRAPPARPGGAGPRTQ